MEDFAGLYSTARDILAVPTKGTDLAFEINNRVNRAFGLQHKISLQKNRYTLLAFLDRSQSPSSSSLLSGSVDTRGLLCANWAQSWPAAGVHSVVQSKYVANVSGSNPNASFLDATVKKVGAHYALTAKLQRQDAEKILVGGSFTQQVTDRWTLGAEAQADREKNSIQGAVAARYAHPLGTIVGTCTTEGKLSAHCSRRVCHYNKPGEDNVGLAAEITVDTKTGRSQTYMGWEFFMPHTKSVVRAAMNGSGRVKAVLEERLNQSTVLSLTTEIDHSSNDFRFGIGVQVGPKPPKKATAVQAATPYDPLKVARWRSWL